MGEVKDTTKEAIRVVKEFERKENREPNDAPAGCGYDILSKSPDGRELHIEVKGRGRLKAPHIFLTDNELQNAKEDSHYQVYIVLGKGADAQLYTIPGRIVAEKVEPETKWRLGLRKWIKEFQQEV